MFTLGLVADRHCIEAALVTLTSSAEAIDFALRRDVGVRILTPDVNRTTLSKLAAAATALGFASFDAKRCVPERGLPLVHGAYITSTTYLRFSFGPPFIDRPFFLYVDSDVLIVDNPGEPFNLVSAEHPYVLVRDEINHSVGTGPALPGFVSRYPRYIGRPYFNAGALWAKAVDFSALASLSLDVSQRHRAYVHFNDQDAL